MRNSRFKITRRDFIATGIGTIAGAALTLNWPAYFYRKFRSIPGEIVGASANIGHLLRGHSLGTPNNHIEVDTVIVGAGISGLFAGWTLKKNKHDQFLILDLESEVGGNSRSGKNNVSAYPWGAHYVPLPSLESKDLLKFFEEVGIVEGYSPNGLPIYKEEFLTHDPEERIFADGFWQEGLIPLSLLNESDKTVFEDFYKYMNTQRDAIGRDGRRLFSIPVDFSSNDAESRALDLISMSEFMNRKKWNSEHLRNYVNYCCRDDFGGTADQVSAWAGIHYFASRDGVSANAEKGKVLNELIKLKNEAT